MNNFQCDCFEIHISFKKCSRTSFIAAVLTWNIFSPCSAGTRVLKRALATSLEFKFASTVYFWTTCTCELDLLFNTLFLACLVGEPEKLTFHVTTAVMKLVRELFWTSIDANIWSYSFCWFIKCIQLIPTFYIHLNRRGGGGWLGVTKLVGEKGVFLKSAHIC